MEKTNHATAPPPKETGVVVNGVNVKEMTDAQLAETAEKAVAVGPQKEAELQAAVQAYSQYRIVLAVLVFELDRRHTQLQVAPPGALVK